MGRFFSFFFLIVMFKCAKYFWHRKYISNIPARAIVVVHPITGDKRRADGQAPRGEKEKYYPDRCAWRESTSAVVVAVSLSAYCFPRYVKRVKYDRHLLSAKLSQKDLSVPSSSENTGEKKGSFNEIYSPVKRLRPKN